MPNPTRNPSVGIKHKRIKLFPTLWVIVVVVFSYLILSPPLLPQTQDKRILIDIPGVGWTGSPRADDWGSLLDPNKTTIYIRHEGWGWDKWEPPKEPNAQIFMLSKEWNRQSAQQLQRAINQAFSKQKDIHFIIDKNITMSRHLLPFPQSHEDRWSASVTDYILKHKPQNYSATLAEHSRGTVTNSFIKNFQNLDYIVISSPLGDQALKFINKQKNLPPIDIVTGLSDAPSWRWTQRLGDIVKKNSNVRILQLQNLSDPATTHSRLQNLGYKGTWKVINNSSSKNYVQGTLNQILRPPLRTHQPSQVKVPQPTTSQPTGGIDFSTVEMRFLSENNKNLFAVNLRAIPTQSNSLKGLSEAGDLAWDAFFTWLALPAPTFWVNLNPNEPDRIIHSELGKTDAGRIMLLADLEMKKTVAKLIHPHSTSGQQYWQQLNQATERYNSHPLCFSFRQWITPGKVQAYKTEDSIYVVDAQLDVKLESEYLELKGEAGTAVATCPKETDPAIQAKAEAIYRQKILPQLIQQVNNAPEYSELRSIFYSRIIAEWYKNRPRNKRAFASALNKDDASDWYSATPWSAKEIFDSYVKSVVEGEFNVSRTTQTRQGNKIITTTNTYLYGGVDFGRIPITSVSYEGLLTTIPEINHQLQKSMFSLDGYSDGEAIWLGGVYEVPAEMRVSFIDKSYTPKLLGMGIIIILLCWRFWYVRRIRWL